MSLPWLWIGMEVTVLSMRGNAHATTVKEASRRAHGEIVWIAYYPTEDGRSSYTFVLQPEDEGTYWTRGHDPKAVDALRVAWALGQSAEPELPPGWTSDTYAIRLGP